MTRRSATASVVVEVDPATAFRAFTEEIDRWWLPGPINAFDSSRLLCLRIEPGVDGRVLEVYDTGDPLELGRITVWEPGARLVFRSGVDDSEVDVTFTADGSGTRVTVEQYVLPDGAAGSIDLFWPRIVRWLVPWCRAHDPARPGYTVAPVSVGLHYEDPVAAARWLADAFGLRSRDRIPAEGEPPGWIELNVGPVAILLFPLDGKRTPEPVTHQTWVYVDDLDAHLALAQARGATIVQGINHHGYRAYTAEDLEGHRWTFAQAPPAMRPVDGR